jgi:23S rRNA (pseudouridine1915-N3)-methyltransferase
MKITIALFGKPKDKKILDLVEEYKKRILRFQKIEFTFLPLSTSVFKENEAIKVVINKFENASKIYFLDEDGKEFSTESCFKMYEQDLENCKEVVFVIGPSEGFGDLKGAAKAKLLPPTATTISLSKLTMQHDIAFLVLTEQIYRVVSIKNNLPYHKI